MSDDARAVPLYFITGFLGSGKTTLLNRALGQAEKMGLRLGVIINEWGQVSIDSGLVRQDSQKELQIEELNNGQVFCSCLTADFIKAMQLFAARNLDAVIVETSGMANPFPLKKLLLDLTEKTASHYKYEFMTALIDPESFLELLGVINTVEEQVAASQRVIINKIDLATREQIAETQKRVRQINPSAQIIETVEAEIPDFFAPPVPSQSAKPPLFGFAPPKQAEEYPRPGNYYLVVKDALSVPAIKKFTEAVLPHSLRVKSIIRDENNVWHYVDGVNKQVKDRVLEGEREGESKIVIIPKGGEDLTYFIKKNFRELVGSEFKLS